MEEVHWRQLSRELWLRKGDGNTAFFHRMANADHRNNSMDKIKINGVWLSEEQEVREGVANAYQQMLSENLVRSTKPSRSWEPGDSLLWGRGSFCFDGYERRQSPRPGWLRSGFLAKLLGLCKRGSHGNVQGVPWTKLFSQEPQYHVSSSITKERIG